MLSVEQCLEQAQECVQLSVAPDCPIDKATILMGVARTYTILANQIRFLNRVIEVEAPPLVPSQTEPQNRQAALG
jgi:hypothetical protein